jgi:hypothetical protein
MVEGAHRVVECPEVHLVVDNRNGGGYLIVLVIAEIIECIVVVNFLSSRALLLKMEVEALALTTVQTKVGRKGIVGVEVAVRLVKLMTPKDLHLGITRPALDNHQGLLPLLQSLL